MSRVGELLAMHQRGMLSSLQLIDRLRDLGVADPVGLAGDRTLPDPSSVGFEQRASVYIAPSPMLGWSR